MIYILWFLGLLGAVFICLLFSKIKVQIVYNETQAFIHLNYFFFSYHLDLKEKVEEIAENIEEKAKETFESLQDDNPLKHVDFKREEHVLKVRPEEQDVLEHHKVSTEELKTTSQTTRKPPANFKQPKKEDMPPTQPKRFDDNKPDEMINKTTWLEKWNVFNANRTQQKIKKQASKKRDNINKRIDKIQFKEKKEKIFLTIKQYKIYLEVGLRILKRLVSRVHINHLFSHLNFNVEDPMLCGCLLGMAWSVNANVYRFIQTHVKKVTTLDFDVKTQFSGNNIFMKFECIISVRLVDIIMVFLLSLRDLLIIRKTYKMKEDLI